MPQPLISIILPTYNRAHMIDSAIVSILQQSFTNFELIIVNDCSTDHTQQMLAKWQQQDKRIKIITNRKNQKLPESLNIGFRHARGKYLTWTSDDNRYKQGALEFMVRHLEKNPTTDMVTTMQDLVDDNGKILNRHPNFWFNQFFDISLLAYSSNIGGCFLYRRSIAQKVGNYDNNLFGAEDYDFTCRLALLGRIDFVPKNLYIYQVHSGSLGNTIKPKVQAATEYIKKKYQFALNQKYPLTPTTKPIAKRITLSLYPNRQHLMDYLLHHPWHFLRRPPICYILKVFFSKTHH